MTVHYIGEISPGQDDMSGILRDCPTEGVVWDISRMNDINIEAIRSRIKNEMLENGFSKRSLSNAAGLSESAVRDVLDRVNNPGIGTLYKIAEALQLPLEDITAANGVELMGEIGAGGLVARFKDDHEKEYVPRPPLAPGKLMALRVCGDSMLPKYESGDIVYVRRDHDGVLPAYIGKYCAVLLSDGGTYLKILARGTVEGRFTLRSLNAADMEDVEVVWAAPVLFVRQV